MVVVVVVAVVVVGGEIVAGGGAGIRSWAAERYQGRAASNTVPVTTPRNMNTLHCTAWLLTC